VAPRAEPSGTPAAVEQVPPNADLPVYFPRMDAQGRVSLVRTERRAAPGQPALDAAVAQFLAGPTGEQRARDVGIALRRGTAVRSVSLREHTAVVDFGREVQQVAGKPWVEAVYWSLVLTLLDVPGVQHIELRVEGQPLRLLGTPPFSVPTDPRREQVPFPVQPLTGGPS
jgi:spore germination protein GerM